MITNLVESSCTSCFQQSSCFTAFSLCTVVPLTIGLIFCLDLRPTVILRECDDPRIFNGSRKKEHLSSHVSAHGSGVVVATAERGSLRGYFGTSLESGSVQLTWLRLWSGHTRQPLCVAFVRTLADSAQLVHTSGAVYLGQCGDARCLT